MKYADEIFLIQKLKEGEIRALEEIFNRHYGNLCKFLSLLFKAQIEVEHIAQDIFVYLWENRDRIIIRGSLESYIYAAGKYKGLNHIRNVKRHQALNQAFGERADNSHDTTQNRLEAEELHSIVESAVSRLPKKCQQIFRLSCEEELTYKEIANLLGLSINTVEGQMTIAHKKLRKTLRPYYSQNFKQE